MDIVVPPACKKTGSQDDAGPLTISVRIDRSFNTAAMPEHRHAGLLDLGDRGRQVDGSPWRLLWPDRAISGAQGRSGQRLQPIGHDGHAEPDPPRIAIAVDMSRPAYASATSSSRAAA